MMMEDDGERKKLAWRSYPPLLLLRIGGSIHLHTVLAVEIKAFAYALTRHSVPSNPKRAADGISLRSVWKLNPREESANRGLLIERWSDWMMDR